MQLGILLHNGAPPRAAAQHHVHHGVAFIVEMPPTRSCGRLAQGKSCWWQAPARRTRRFSRAVRTDEPAATAGDELQTTCLYGVPVENYRLTSVKNNMFFLFKCLMQRNSAQNQSYHAANPDGSLNGTASFFVRRSGYHPLPAPERRNAQAARPGVHLLHWLFIPTTRAPDPLLPHTSGRKCSGTFCTSHGSPYWVCSSRPA